MIETEVKQEQTADIYFMERAPVLYQSLLTDAQVPLAASANSHNTNQTTSRQLAVFARVPLKPGPIRQ